MHQLGERIICEKNRGTAIPGCVKHDYLIELVPHWYRFDTIRARNFADRGGGAQSSVFSPAKSVARGSRGRTSTAFAPSTMTSQGRGREL